MNNRLAHRITALLASRRFFWAVVGFFVIEALWFVFAFAYPMAFDERFHFESVKVYANNFPSPFLLEHPAGADALGSIERDVSYLFHYLMGFAYQFIQLFSNNQGVQVVFLRLLNVAMFTGGLLLFAQVLRRAGLSKALTNTALAIFILVPIVPYLAAHINYDNLVFLMLPWLILLAFQLVDGFKQKQVNAKALLTFIIGCVFIGLVKLAALPLVVAITAFLLMFAVRYFRDRPRLFFTSTWEHLKQMSPIVKVGLVVAFIIGFGLFFQRYGVNIISYGSLSPDCGDVLTTEQCLEYGPWARNYYLLQEATPDTQGDGPVTYIREWLWGMWHRSFFAVSGADNDFANTDGLPLPKYTAIVLAVFGLLAIVVKFRDTFRGRPYLQLLAIMSVFYAVVLWLELYTGVYSQTGEPVAINGRYLIPILLPLAAVMGTAFHALLKQRQNTKAYLATATILLFLGGGGVFTYIILSDASWLWLWLAV